MISLYFFPFSQHSRRVISLLEEANIEYQGNLVDMMKGEHKSIEYLEINPNHQVPSLIDGKVCLHESNTIMRYLCDKYQLDDWYPTTLEKRAQVDQWLDWCQCRFGPAVKDIVFNSVFAEKAGVLPDQNAIIRGNETLIELVSILENHLSINQFLGANHATIADLALASNVFHLSLAKQQISSPAVLAWYDKVASLQGFQKSLPQL